MTHQPSDDDREEPPLILGTLMRAGALGAQAVLRLVQSLGRRGQMILWAAGTIGVFITILFRSIAESPGLAGVGQGIAVGGLASLIFAAGVGWLLIWAHRDHAPRAVDDAAAAAELNALFAPALKDLNAVRAEVVRQVKVRSLTRVPLGIGMALALWALSLMTDDPPGLGELVMYVVVGAVGGEIWAASTLESSYKRLYKDRILPQLAARLGDLTYSQAAAGHMHGLPVDRIFSAFDSADADDAITGTYRGLPIEIVEARLHRRSGDDTQTIFDGLIVTLTLPRGLTGTTVILSDAGLIGNLKARWKAGALEPVRLEDVRFEQRYQVYGSDQIEARALLTPAFMERFTELAARAAPPGALAEGRRLIVALPKRIGAGDLFEPPVYWKPAGGRALLVLEQDIRSVLRMADAVVELDFWAAGRARDSRT